MSVAVAFASNGYSREHLNTASLKGYSLHCIIFRTATDSADGTSFGLASAQNIVITGGTLIAKAGYDAETKAAFNKTPILNGYTGGYDWNINESNPSWTLSSSTEFENIGNPSYVKILPAIKISVDLDGDGENLPTIYNNFEEGWNEAVGEGNTENTIVKLLTNWMASGNGTNNSFGTGAGFGDGNIHNNGYIRIPENKNITIDLNGFNIDRAMTSPIGTNISDAGWGIGNYGTLTLKDGSTDITENQGKITGGYNSYTDNSAGGIFVAINQKLTINGGRIVGNKGINLGGAIYAGENSLVTMTGGKIARNIANYNNDSGQGAGCIFLCGSFVMTGGEILENYACGLAKAGGIYWNSGNISVGGKAVIKDNIAGAIFETTTNTVTGGKASNVYLTHSKTITCSTTVPITAGAYIGVTTVDVPSISETVAVTGSNSTNYSGYFNSDNSLYSVYNDSNVVKLRRADFTITYNAGSGTGTVPSAATKYNNVDFTAIDATYPLTMDGYTQVGWKLNAESFDGQGAVTTLTANEAIALYPVWAINTYQVKLTDNDTGITGFKYRIDAANDSALWITYNEQFTVNHGQKLEIQAILDSNYIFEKWTTGITINPYTISRVTALINYTPTSIFVTKETKPSASFLATDADKGVLSNVSSGMKYKIDSGEWQTITGTIVNLTDMHSCVITIYQPGNGTTTIDSEEQTITVTKAVQPNLTQTQPAVVNGKEAFLQQISMNTKLQLLGKTVMANLITWMQVPTM